MARCGAMERRPLGSSVLLEAGYDPDDQVLELVFANGRIYRFEQVPELVHRRLLRAPSAGSFFNAEIRDRYPSERVDDRRGAT
jgi:lysyl-tRNA synthetase class 2